MRYVNFISRATGEIFAYDMDDELQVAAIPIELEELSDGELAAIRDAQDTPSHDQLVAMGLSTRDDLLVFAALRIGPLQDALDLGDATQDDVDSLKRWKQFRVSVNRVPNQPGFPSEAIWPETPQ